jgi:hypothetical protein
MTQADGGVWRQERSLSIARSRGDYLCWLRYGSVTDEMLARDQLDSTASSDLLQADWHANLSLRWPPSLLVHLSHVVCELRFRLESLLAQCTRERALYTV